MVVTRERLSAALGADTLAALLLLEKRLGQPLLLAGGTARDVLCGYPPRELDLSTPARPERITQALDQWITGDTPFGVFTLRVNETTVELAAQRTDGPYDDHRRPAWVRFAGIEEDTARRDFTLNALYVPLDCGEVVDLCGGLADLRARRINMVGPVARLGEDHVRPIRLVRFLARLEFEADPALVQAAKDFAAEKKHLSLSGQRWFMEINHFFSGGGAARAFELLDEWGLLQGVLPEVAAMRGVEQGPPHHPEGDVWVHTLLLLRALGRTTPRLGWAALLHDVAKPLTRGQKNGKTTFYGHVEQGADMAGKILNRFGAPSVFVKEVVRLVQKHLFFKDVAEVRGQKLSQFLHEDLATDHLLLHQADCLASHSQLQTLALLRHRQLLAPSLPAELALPLNGRDLMAAGVPPGPEVGRLLQLARHLMEQEGLTEREVLLVRVMQKAKKASFRHKREKGRLKL